MKVIILFIHKLMEVTIAKTFGKIQQNKKVNVAVQKKNPNFESPTACIID
jgi:hypothetical protein